MKHVSVDGLREVLAGRGLNQVGDSLLQADVKLPQKAGPLRFAPEALLAIRVLNRPEDRDEDGVFGADSHIAFDRASAWVKYKMTGRHEGTLAFAPASIKRGSEVELSDYRIHAATDDAWQSLRSDLAAPRNLLDIEDVRSLEPGEALALETGGAVKASITFSWSEAIAERFRDLVRDLPVIESLAVRLHSGLESTAAVKIDDQFSIVISRTREGRYRIAVRKARSRNHTFGVEVSLGAEVSAVPAVDRALAPLFESLTGVALETAERIADRAGIGQLSTEENAFVERLARVLKIATTADREKSVADAIRKLRRELRERLAKIGQWKAAITFATEYACIEENEAIADYVVEEVEELERDHALLLAGNFEQISRSLRDDAGSRTLIRYLNETTVTHRASSGFSIGIGRWPRVEAKDESILRVVQRRSLDGFSLLNYRGVQRYEERLIPQNDVEWSVELKAAMPEYLERPTSLDFRYSLRYAVTLERDFLSATDLERMLDFATMWNVQTKQQVPLAGALGRKATIRVQFRLDHDELASTLAETDHAEWATSLAAAMPYASFFAERRTYEERIATYRDAWAAWLSDSGVDVSRSLRSRLRSGITLLEEANLPGSFGWTTGTGHPQLRRRRDEFVRGARMLHDAMTERHPHQNIATAYDALRQFWTQRLYVAASGHWLLACAARAGVDANRSIQIDLGDSTITA